MTITYQNLKVNEGLANKFPQYIMSKIKSIRYTLDSHPLYIVKGFMIDVPLVQ